MAAITNPQEYTDMLEEPISLGDTVAFTMVEYKGLSLGKIIGFSAKCATIQPYKLQFGIQRSKSISRPRTDIIKILNSDRIAWFLLKNN